jgi:hypothetical protein
MNKNNLELKQKFFQSLTECQKRHFAALEANELGYHGVTIISKLYDIHPHTIRRGQEELSEASSLSKDSIRNKGGGRKKT